MLFVVWDEKTHRPTRDLARLSFGSPEKEDLQKVFHDEAALPVMDGGLLFEPASVRAEEIREDNTYGGIRVRIMAKRGLAEVPVQIDVGGGDAVTPAPKTARFPARLDFPVPQIRVNVHILVAQRQRLQSLRDQPDRRVRDEPLGTPILEASGQQPGPGSTARSTWRKSNTPPSIFLTPLF